MLQTNGPDNSESVSLRMSSVALLQPEIRAKTDSTSQDDSNDTNSCADLARVADRVQTSGRNRRTCLIILHRFLCVSAL
eukprot:7576703-Pyramimonas_sp.AAC.1